MQDNIFSCVLTATHSILGSVRQSRLFFRKSIYIILCVNLSENLGEMKYTMTIIVLFREDLISIADDQVGFYIELAAKLFFQASQV